MFLGISFITHNYINPSINIIKVKGVLSSDTMNATLLAMTNSAAESFIIMNSIFFGNSDIGIYTVVGETAFYTLIIQGGFYFLSERGTKVDWWIITRDSFFILCYLGVLSGLLNGNDISWWKALILLVLYFVHILFMKYNYIYEIFIKKSVTKFFETWEIRKKARKEIDQYYKKEIELEKNNESDTKNENKIISSEYRFRHFHISPRVISLEQIREIKFTIEGKYIVVDNLREKAH
jgi:Ca2+/Na+ antiporter